MICCLLCGGSGKRALDVLLDVWMEQEREELEAYRCALEAQGRSVTRVEAKLSSIHASQAGCIGGLSSHPGKLT